MKIDINKFVASLIRMMPNEMVLKTEVECALRDQGLEYKDGEIVEIDTIDTSSPRWAEIVKECKHDASEQAKKITITIPEDLKGTDTDGGVVGEKGEEGVPPKFNRKRLEEVAKPETLEEKVEHWQRMHDVAMEKIKGTFKEEDSLETKAIKEQIENLKKRIEDNQLGCIVQRLDKIIELLQSAILILPKEPYIPPIIYKRPLDPDPLEG